MTCVGRFFIWGWKIRRGSVNVFSIDLFWWKNDQSNVGIHHSGCKAEIHLWSRKMYLRIWRFLHLKTRKRDQYLTVWRSRDMFQSRRVSGVQWSVFPEIILYLHRFKYLPARTVRERFIGVIENSGCQRYTNVIVRCNGFPRNGGKTLRRRCLQRFRYCREQFRCSAAGSCGSVLPKSIWSCGILNYENSKKQLQDCTDLKYGIFGKHLL